MGKCIRSVSGEYELGRNDESDIQGHFQERYFGTRIGLQDEIRSQKAVKCKALSRSISEA